MITVEMSKLLSILISHFGSEGQIQTAEALKKLRDEPLGTVTPFPIDEDFDLLQKPEAEDDISWAFGDACRLKEEHWSHSKGIRGATGKIVKVNRKRVKVSFKNRVKIINVPKDMLERI